MIEIKRRDGQPVDLSNPRRIPVVGDVPTKQSLRIVSFHTMRLPYELEIPEGYEAVFEPVGEVPMPNPTWTGYIDVSNATRIIPAGSYGHGKPNGYATVDLHGKENSGGGSLIRAGQTIGYLHFRKAAEVVIPNTETPADTVRKTRRKRTEDVAAA